MNRKATNTGSLLDLDLHAQFPDFTLRASIEIESPGITGIIGPSGCGKTTLLRCIAGLQDFSGTCRVQGERLQEPEFRQAVHQRNIAYVFQGDSLFPHLSVQQNIEYGWKRDKRPHRYTSLAPLIQTLELEDLLKRHVTDLSGGQKQRVALARALASKPGLLLLDEPLSALDDSSKRHIIRYLKSVHKTFNTSMLFVSHSIQEHAQLVDQLIVMNRGRIEQYGPITNILSDMSLSLNQQEDAGVVIEASVAEVDQQWHLIRAECEGVSIWLKQQDEKPGQSLRIRLLARDLSISLNPPEQHSILNTLPARIITIADTAHPAHKLVQLALGNRQVLSRITAKSCSELGLSPNMSVWVLVKSAAVID